MGHLAARDRSSPRSNAPSSPPPNAPGHALAEAGYFGPFGVDAYEWRTPEGGRALRTLGEINARFCMDWDALDGWAPPPPR
ncbi:MAG: hypothetical protein R3B99_01200 [Polyangiales bacterium]